MTDKVKLNECVAPVNYTLVASIGAVLAGQEEEDGVRHRQRD
jgi:hypothetical protein